MQTVTLLSALVVVAVVLLTAPQTVDADCCRKSFGDRCGDCTTGTPYCGYGKCNLFGCNCKGGCRRGGCSDYKKRSVDESINAESLISAGDLNGDGLLSIDEAATLLQQDRNEEHRRSVRSLDKNMDGMLTADEID